MNRFVQFVRSLLPTKPTQLLLIAGLVCLTIVPRLNWLPADITSFVADLAYAGHTTSEELRWSWIRFLGIASYTFVFAASAGFFVCYWPGKSPARRILSLVLLPAFVGLGAICFRYLSLLASPRSVLQRGSTFDHGPTWVISKLWNLGTAFHFCVAGLAFVVAFALLLAQKKTSLPISVLPQSVKAVEESDAWSGCKRLIWIFQGAPALTAIPLNLISLLALLVPPSRPVTWQYDFTRALSPTAEGVVFFVIAVWAMGKDNWKFIRQQIQVPTLRYAGIGIAIPVAAVLLPSLAVYLFDRADWAAHAFNRLEPPRFGDYFGVPETWMLALFLGAFAEEVIFRGVLQRHFVERFGLWRGICFVGIIWAAFHFHGDARYRLGDLGVAIALSSRLIMCTIHGFVLSWLTLRSKSLLPATLAHGLYNVFVDSKSGFSFPGQHWVHLGLWALLAYALFRYWPPKENMATIEALEVQQGRIG